MPALKRSITVKDSLLKAAEIRQHQLGLPNFSRYIAWLIERDTPPASIGDQIRTALEDLAAALRQLPPGQNAATTAAIETTLANAANPIDGATQKAAEKPALYLTGNNK